MDRTKSFMIHASVDDNDTVLTIVECEGREVRMHMKRGLVADYILGCLDREFNIPDSECPVKEGE